VKIVIPRETSPQWHTRTPARRHFHFCVSVIVAGMQHNMVIGGDLAGFRRSPGRDRLILLEYNSTVNSPQRR